MTNFLTNIGNLIQANLDYSPNELEKFIVDEPLNIRRIFIQAIRIFFRWPQSIVFDIVNFNKYPSRRVNWFFHGNNRHVESQNRVKFDTCNSIFITNRWKNVTECYLPHSLVVFISLIVSPLFIYNLIVSPKKTRKALLYFLYDYYHTVGHYYSYILLIKIFKPLKVIVSNETRSEYTTLIMAANLYGIETVLIPHGYTYLPSVENQGTICKYRLLSGEKQVQDFCSGNLQCIKKSFLISIPKIKKFKVKTIAPKSFFNIGVAVNSEDDLILVHDLIIFLVELNFIRKIYFRSKNIGKSQTKWLKKILKLKSVIVSDVDNDDLSGFLHDVDVIIAGESNILLESSYVNNLSISYNFNHKVKGDIGFDVYGFKQNGIVYFVDIGNNKLIVNLLDKYKENIEIQEAALESYIHNSRGPTQIQKYDLDLIIKKGGL